jgi:uncharacterized membrane protein YccC
MKIFSKSFRTALAISGALIISVSAFALRPVQTLDQTATNTEITRLTSKILEKSQFAHHPLDDELAGKFLDRYRDTLDGQHLLFLQSDVDEFVRFKPTLAQATRRDGDSSPARVIFARYLEQLDQRAAYVAQLLRTEHFDFSTDEQYTTIAKTRRVHPISLPRNDSGDSISVPNFCRRNSTVKKSRRSRRFSRGVPSVRRRRCESSTTR